MQTPRFICKNPFHLCKKEAKSRAVNFLELELTPSGLVVLQYNQIPVFLLAPPNFSIFSKSRQHGGNRPPD